LNAGELILDSCTTTDDSSYQCVDESFCMGRGCCESLGSTDEAKEILRCPKNMPFMCRVGGKRKNFKFQMMNGEILEDIPDAYAFKYECAKHLHVGCDELKCTALADGSVGRASGGRLMGNHAMDLLQVSSKASKVEVVHKKTEAEMKNDAYLANIMMAKAEASSFIALKEDVGVGRALINSRILSGDNNFDISADKRFVSLMEMPIIIGYVLLKSPILP